MKPEKETRPIGARGLRHKRYLMEHKKDIFIRLVKDMAKAESVTEKLKAENQMAWVQKMNNIRNCAMEIVNSELIYI